MSATREQIEQFEREWETLATAVRTQFPSRAHDYPKGPSPRRASYVKRRVEELTRWHPDDAALNTVILERLERLVVRKEM